MAISVAIVGAGPAGFYTAEALLESGADVRIDIIERLPTPFGLIRAGVAPDHQSTKQVARRFEQTALQALVDFFGNVEIGEVVTIEDLRASYDAVVLAVGAGLDRPLGIPGELLPGVYGSALFVGWYNGHPDFRTLSPHLDTRAAVVIGNGNVALDVARVLVKSADEMATSDLPEEVGRAIRAGGIEDVYIIGRRGAADARFTSVELREVGNLAECETLVDPDDVASSGDPGSDRQRRQSERNLAILRGLATFPRGVKPKRLHFRFNLTPVAIEGRRSVDAVRFERTRVVDGRLVGTGEFVRIACGLVIPAVGYRSFAIPGIPFDPARGLYPSTDGRIAPGLYAVGWAKRGPSGVIGSNRPDGEICAAQIAADAAVQGFGEKPGRPAFEACLRARGIRSLTFDDWRRIDAAEIAAATGPAPRRKFTDLAEMLALLAEDTRSIPAAAASMTAEAIPETAR